MSEVTSISSQFDIFMHRHIQTAVQGTVETVYKPLVPVEQNLLEFLIPGDSDTYIDLYIKLYVRLNVLQLPESCGSHRHNCRGQ
jgi:hypothetical protein